MRHDDVAHRPAVPRRRALALAGAAAGAAALSACGSTDRRSITSAEASPDAPLRLTLANSLDPKHITSQALQKLADDVAERSDGRIILEMFDSGQLGSEPQVLGQMRQGIIDLVRVGSPGLAAWNPGYHGFGLPYVFDSGEHYYRAMDSEAMRAFLTSGQERGFVGLTYFTSGARSFYTASTPVRSPEDARGMKIRVQDMRTQVQMMNAFGASPIVMGFGDTYTALQTGLIDGAESNETVLTQSGHGEVAKVFSLTEHTRIPDLLAMGAPAWERLDEADRTLLQEAAADATAQHRTDWDASIEQAYTEAAEMGVEFIDDVDVDAFRELAAPVVADFAEQHQEVADLLAIIDRARA